MTLDQWLTLLGRQHPVAIDLGLERLTTVAERLSLTGRPLARHVVTVAGTNGKGSTVAMVDAIARAHGLSSGTYSSPHLRRYNERVTVKGQYVTDDQLVAAFERIEAARTQPGLPEVSLTYFEVGTLAAALIFQEAALDVVVLEVGLGGRLDAVNIFDADVGVVTTIGIDHVEYLGSDINAIGREKAGIFRRGAGAVLGSSDLPASVREVAEHCGVGTLRQLGESFVRTDAVDGHWSWSGHDAKGNDVELVALPDPHLPLDNAASAIQAAWLAFGPLSAERVARALSSLDMPGRLQWKGPWCLDVSHNPHAAAYVARYFKARERQGTVPARRVAVLGMLGDKDPDGVIEQLQSVISEWIVVSLAGDRARDADTLVAAVKRHGGHVLARCDTVDQAMHYCETLQPYADERLVCGSFLTVAAALDYLDAQSK
ncbi:bifunctional tetrahydrofolate synthase/dihydrofolate synthase [Zymobacter sp. IVIA_12111.31 C1]|uniref:bifunctional tetrahydrofolate synthase/dihydrofolate synthase n=1 Tax=Zymobacter sp. IVIA_12111.31 C1 TaxID=3394854 RepID=UPI0039C36DE5